MLRADVFRYFPAIDHAVLKQDLRRRIACERTLRLCDTIIDGSNAQEPVATCTSRATICFRPLSGVRGLPIGNLTSQLFGNLYLDPLDHYVSEVLRAPYLRYLDDSPCSTTMRVAWRDGGRTLPRFWKSAGCACTR